MKTPEFYFLIRNTLNGKGTEPASCAFVIDLRTGGTRPKGQLPRHVGVVRFSDEWLSRAHALFMRLINMRTGEPREEWWDLRALLIAAGYVPAGLNSWPREPVEP